MMIRRSLLSLVSCGKVKASTLIGSARTNFFGIFFGGAAGCHKFCGMMCGTLIAGSDPISCSSKHSSAAGLVKIDGSSEGKFPLIDPGKDTVADACDSSE